MSKSRLLTPAEVAERLGLSEYTLTTYRQRGIGPRFLRLGGSNAVKYDSRDVEDFLEAQKVQSIAEERAKGRRYNGAAEVGGFR